MRVAECGRGVSFLVGLFWGVLVSARESDCNRNGVPESATCAGCRPRKPRDSTVDSGRGAAYNWAGVFLGLAGAWQRRPVIKHFR